MVSVLLFYPCLKAFLPFVPFCKTTLPQSIRVYQYCQWLPLAPACQRNFLLVLHPPRGIWGICPDAPSFFSGFQVAFREGCAYQLRRLQ